MRTPTHRFMALLALVPLSLLTAGCGEHPEEALLGCWAETRWTYERADELLRETQPEGAPRWNDGIRSREYPEARWPRHEAELWWFHSRGELAIAGMDGTLAGARWRLKGRGHVLTIRSGEDGHEHFEAYDIKELRDDLLVLNVDVGMEVRGIARLEFERTDCVGALREGRIKELRATGGAS